MKEYIELAGALGIVALCGIGILLFIALVYGAVFGSILGVVYLFIKGVAALFA